MRRDARRNEEAGDRLTLAEVEEGMVSDKEVEDEEEGEVQEEVEVVVVLVVVVEEGSGSIDDGMLREIRMIRQRIRRAMIP